MNLNARLKSIAKLVPSCNSVADIGTDHAYLPINLVQNNIVRKVIGVELNPGPVKKARGNIEKFELSKFIEVREGYGLDPILPEEVEVAIISGVGGNNITEIIAQSLTTARSLEKIIIQPMSKIVEVRDFLQSNNFCLEDEELVMEDGHYYEILVTRYGNAKKYNDFLLEIGPILLEKKHPLLKGYLEEKILKYRQVIDNLERSNSAGVKEKIKYFKEKRNYIEKVISHVNDV